MLSRILEIIITFEVRHSSSRVIFCFHCSEIIETPIAFRAPPLFEAADGDAGHEEAEQEEIVASLCPRSLPLPPIDLISRRSVVRKSRNRNGSLVWVFSMEKLVDVC